MLDDLAALVIQLDDTELVGGDIAIHLVEVAYCDVRYADAIDFASALRARLRRYVRSREVAEAAREEFRERVGWWRLAQSLSGKSGHPTAGETGRSVENDVVDDAHSRHRMCQGVIVEQRITGGGRPYAG